MKISFDLDDTLILTGDESATESATGIFRLFTHEKLRKGTKQLFNELTKLGYATCIYTTSERPISYIRRLFRLYGIQLDSIINHQIHMQYVQGNRKEIMPSKVPSRFGIDLHIDDDDTVKQNGLRYGFRVLLIDRHDRAWAEKVLQEAKKLNRNRH